MKLVNVRVFSVRHGAIFLSFGTLDSTLELCFGAFLNSKTTKKKHTNVTKMALNRWRKEH